MKLLNGPYFKKKILIYGFGSTGISCLNHLKKENSIKCYDDNIKNFNYKKYKKYFIKKKEISKSKFDYIIISPGINSLKCSLKNYIKKNQSKIITDLDVFYSKYYNNLIIAITGTNGKSTACKLLHDILAKSKKDSRLVGNIGNAILDEKKISKKTIFVVEISSYQINYSKFFKPHYGILLNITPDHLERHKTFYNYIKTKFKLLFSLKNNDYAFFFKNEPLFKNFLKGKKMNCKIINVENKFSKQFERKVKNNYFKNENNQQNLSFILKICSKLRIKKSIIFEVVNNFKPLDFRQQIIYNSNKLQIINDSKSTSFSSFKNLINNFETIYWILGGLPKKGDKFEIDNRYQFEKIYIYGKNNFFFTKFFKKKYPYLKFNKLSEAVKQVSIDIKKDQLDKKINLIFSPCAASFDNFKNFEERGKYFNYLIDLYNIKNAR